MRRIAAVVIALMVIIGAFAPAVTTAATRPAGQHFPWEVLSGDPRGLGKVESVADAIRWFRSAAGSNDMRRMGLSVTEIRMVQAAIAENGIATRTVRVGDCFDGPLTFSREGRVEPGPTCVRWTNAVSATGYIPKGISGRIPVLVGGPAYRKNGSRILGCANMTYNNVSVAIIPPPPPPPPPPVIVQPPVPSPITQGFPLYVEVRAKDAQRGLRAVVATVGLGSVVNTTLPRSVRPLSDPVGKMLIFSGTVEFWVDYRSARLVQTDGSTAALPDPRTLDTVSRGPLVGAGLYQAGPPSMECLAGVWQPVGQIAPVRDDGTRLWFAVEMTASTRVIVELRTLPGQLGVVFHPFCRQPLN